LAAAIKYVGRLVSGDRTFLKVVDNLRRQELAPNAHFAFRAIDRLGRLKMAEIRQFRRRDDVVDALAKQLSVTVVRNQGAHGVLIPVGMGFVNQARMHRAALPPQSKMARDEDGGEGAAQHRRKVAGAGYTPLQRPGRSRRLLAII